MHGVRHLGVTLEEEDGKEDRDEDEEAEELDVVLPALSLLLVPLVQLAHHLDCPRGLLLVVHVIEILCGDRKKIQEQKHSTQVAIVHECGASQTDY